MSPSCRTKSKCHTYQLCLTTWSRIRYLSSTEPAEQCTPRDLSWHSDLGDFYVVPYKQPLLKSAPSGADLGLCQRTLSVPEEFRSQSRSELGLGFDVDPARVSGAPRSMNHQTARPNNHRFSTIVAFLSVLVCLVCHRNKQPTFDVSTVKRDQSQAR